MAIDPTAPITPMIPAAPASDATDPAKVLLALARAAAANNAATLGEIAAGRARADPDAVKAAAGANLTASTAPDTSGQLHAEPLTPAAPSAADRMSAAVRSAAAQAAPRQAGLAPMMANLDAAVARPETPEPVRQAAKAVFDKALPTTQPVTATALREAVRSSGLFLEAGLARAAPIPESTKAPSRATGGDMKAALLVLRAVVSTWLAKASAVAPEPRTLVCKSATESEAEPMERVSTPPQGGYAQPSRLGRQAQAPPTVSMTPSDDEEALFRSPATSEPTPGAAKPATAGASTPLTPSVELDVVEDAPLEPLEARADLPPGHLVRSPSTAAQRPPLMVGLIEEEALDVASPAPEDAAPLPTPRGAGYVSIRPQTPSRPPPPYAGGPTTAQAATRSDLPQDMPPAELARRLLKDVGGAIARQELSQIASLPEGRREAERAVEIKSPRWVFDLPFQTPQGVAVAQFEINKDGGGGGADGGQEIERTWRARFSLDVEPLGPVHVQIALTGAMTRVGFWAERPDAMARLKAGEAALNAALRQAELTPEVAFHSGAPAVAPAAPGYFVDRAT